MNTLYSDFIQKHLDILSFRDLAPKTISTCLSYLDEFLNWVEKELSGKILSEVSYEEIRIYLRYLKEFRKLNNRTINVHIAQLRDFYLYVLHKDWDRYQVSQADQLLGYKRDLEEYHVETCGKTVYPILVLTLTKGLQNQKKR